MLANSSRATASLFTFIILLSTATVVIVYLTAALAAWKVSPARAARAVIATGILFLAFATYGIGAEPVLWSLVLLAIGLAIRTVMHRLNSRKSKRATEAIPAAPVG